MFRAINLMFRAIQKGSWIDENTVAYIEAGMMKIQLLK